MEEKLCTHPVFIERSSLSLHTAVSCSCSYSCGSSLETFPIFQKRLTYQLPYETFPVLQGCCFYLLCCDTILNNHTKPRLARPKKLVSVTTAGLFLSCIFLSFLSCKSKVVVKQGHSFIWVFLAVVKGSERLKCKVPDSGYSP